MSTRKAITVRLDSEDYERLSSEAKRLGVRPGTLARVYIRAGLSRDGEPEAERKRRVGLEALARLARLTPDLPPVDALKVVQASREELERGADE